MSTAGNLRTARILVLEDERALAAAWGEVLARRGHAVATIDTQEAAWRLLTGRVFDLLVSDYHVADGTALDLCCRLAAADACVPMILVTAAGDVERVRAAYGDHLRDVLRKPVLADELGRAVDRCLCDRLTARCQPRALVGRAERGVLTGDSL